MENINTDTKKIEEFVTDFNNDIIEYKNSIIELYKLIKNVKDTSWIGEDKTKYINYCLEFEESYLSFAELLENYLKLYKDAYSTLNEKIVASSIGDIK